jgi:DNA-binding response OmpR family regulator
MEIEVDGFTLYPDGIAIYNGQRIKTLTGAEACVLFSVAKAKGRCIAADAVGNRVSDTEDPGNLAAVLVCRIRKKLSDIGVPSPIETVWHSGYRWAMPT